MSSEQKIIKINHDISNIGRRRGRSTRKNTSSVSPLKNSNTNSLRKKLLERLEKNRQSTFSIPTKSLNSQSHLQSKQKPDANFSQPLNEDLEMPETSELEDSIKYLSELSKMTKIKKSDTDTPFASPLPGTFTQSSINKYKVDNQVGYGCLKKGIKPCYRTWVKTMKNNSDANIIRNQNQTQTNMLSLNMKEEKLKNIRRKLVDTIQSHKNNLINQPIQFAEQQQQQNINPYPLTFYNEEKEIQQPHHHQTIQQIQPIQLIPSIEPIPSFPQEIKDIMLSSSLSNPLSSSSSLPPPIITTSTIPMIRTTKRTVNKKYTLGKNSNKRKVGLLIKNNQTRKNIMLAHKELKVKPLQDVKKYLREHGLIRAGSSCPQDCLRKIYESSKLSGDITNTNPDNIIHNMLQKDDE
jgi:hypothetical protein